MRRISQPPRGFAKQMYSKGVFASCKDSLILYFYSSVRRLFAAESRHRAAQEHFCGDTERTRYEKR